MSSKEKSPNSNYKFSNSFKEKSYNLGSSKHSYDSSSENRSSLKIIKITNICSNVELNQFKLCIPLNKQKILFNLKSIIKKQKQDSIDIIPSKLFALKNFIFFTFFEKDNKNMRLSDFNLFINSKGKYTFLNSSTLGFKIKNENIYSNFHSIEINIDNSIIIFLVVNNIVFIIKFDEIEYVILFKKEFQNMTSITLIKSEYISNNEFLFYLHINNSLRFLIFNCDFIKSDFNSYEKSLDYLINYNENVTTISKFTVLDGYLYFYENLKKTINCFSLKSLQIRSIFNGEIKNYLIINQKDKNREYLVRDELENNYLNISLYLINNDNTNILIQKISIFNDNKDFGDYKLNMVGENYVVICFYEFDTVFILKINNNTILTTSDDNFIYFEDAYILEFEELYAYMNQFKIDNNILYIYSYREDFIKYEIDINEVLKYDESKNSENLKDVDQIFSKNDIKINDESSREISYNNTESKMFLKSLEDKIEEIINNKLNSFTENLNSKLNDTFSFFKKQTEELEEIRRRNDYMLNNLVILFNNKCVNPIQRNSPILNNPTQIRYLPNTLQNNNDIKNYNNNKNKYFPKNKPKEIKISNEKYLLDSREMSSIANVTKEISESNDSFKKLDNNNENEQKNKSSDYSNSDNDDLKSMNKNKNQMNMES